MPQIIWLALGYNAPVEPSKNRVYVWRKLKECGAGYFRPGVAILPNNAVNMSKFSALAAKIKEMGGEAVIAELKYCNAKDENDTIERFKSHARNEYNELVSDSKGLTSLSPDQLDEHLKKLVKRYGKARARDFFGGNDSLSQGLVDLADDMERVASGLGRQFKNMLDL